VGIVAEGITKSFGVPPVSVLKDITLSIESGDFVSLTGRSGSGKSTLLYILSSLDDPTVGTVRIDDQYYDRMKHKDLHHFRNVKMGFVFQFHYLLPELSAAENVLMPARKLNLHQDKKAYASELLDRFGLKDRFHHLPRQLSGGEQQRVAIARALIMNPSYLFADEPTGNLDSVNGDIVMNIFREINAQEKTTIVYVTHDRGYAELARQTLQLVDGQLMPPPSSGKEIR